MGDLAVPTWPCKLVSGRLPVCEVFGPTIQGEGPASGQLCSFIRFGGCNLGCWWCDSRYTWDGSMFDLRDEISLVSADEVLERLPDARICVVTGGEPLLYQRRTEFFKIIRRLCEQGWSVHVETNGTIEPLPWLIDLVETFVVSPKLPHARAQKGRSTPALDLAWSIISRQHDVHLKIVVRSSGDVKSVARMALDMGWDPRCVWVMPEGRDRHTLERRWPDVCTWAIEYGLNVSHRLHVLAWGEARGH